ncbi:MAG: NfeD family protein [Actinomycetaceae bacterium]|nr:NfeD family protein [Actinomycetaceae bacterium]
MSWLIWLGIALVLGIIEMLTADFIFLMIAGGALATAGASAIWPDSLAIQAIVFAIVSVLLLVLVRPWVKARVLPKDPRNTNVHALIGQEAIVVQPVNSMRGQVKIGGEIWSAKSEETSSGEAVDIPVGHTGRVKRIEGATAIVSIEEQH